MFIALFFSYSQGACLPFSLYCIYENFYLCYDLFSEPRALFVFYIENPGFFFLYSCFLFVLTEVFKLLINNQAGDVSAKVSSLCS